MLKSEQELNKLNKMFKRNEEDSKKAKKILAVECPNIHEEILPRLK